MIRVLLIFILLLVPATASAQLGSVPYVFSSGTTIRSAEVNANFTTAYSDALNRTGGTMTGTLTAQVIVPDGDNTRNFGSAAASWASAWFDGTVTIATLTATTGTIATISGTTTASGAWTFSAAGTALTVNNNATVSGTLTAGTFSGSGASLTNLPAGQLTGTIADARLSANVALLNAANTFAANQAVQGTFKVGASGTQYPVTIVGNNTVGALIATVTDENNLSTSAGVPASRLVNANVAPFEFQTSPATTVGAARTWTTRMSLSEAGLLTVSGFGTHSFSASGSGEQSVRVRNTSNAGSAYASVLIGNDTSSAVGELSGMSSTSTFVAPYAANGFSVIGSQSGGLSIAATDAAGDIRFYSGGTTLRGEMYDSGGFCWGSSCVDPSGVIMHVRGQLWVKAGNSFYVESGNSGVPFLSVQSGVIAAGNDGLSTEGYFKMAPTEVGGIYAKPTCNSTNRGALFHTAGGAGVKDNVEVCAKDAADAYAWRTIY